MTLYPDPTPALTPPAPPDPRRNHLLDLAAQADDMGGVDLLVNVIRICGGLTDVDALLDLIDATVNLAALEHGGADPVGMLGEDYAGPGGRDLGRQAMTARQDEALDKLLAGAR